MREVVAATIISGQPRGTCIKLLANVLHEPIDVDEWEKLLERAWTQMFFHRNDLG